MVRSQGFEWRPRKPGATTVESQKWAWVGEQPGAHAVLRLNTVVSTQPDEEPPQQQQKESQQPQQQQHKGLQAGKGGGSAAPTAAAAGGPTGAPDLARVWLSHVCSWQDLGSASVACVGGCACANATMDHWWQHERTLSDLFELEVGGGCRDEGGPQGTTLCANWRIRVTPWHVPRACACHSPVRDALGTRSAAEGSAAGGRGGGRNAARRQVLASLRRPQPHNSCELHTSRGAGTEPGLLPLPP